MQSGVRVKIIRLDNFYSDSELAACGAVFSLFFVADLYASARDKLGGLKAGCQSRVIPVHLCLPVGKCSELSMPSAFPLTVFN